MSESRTISRRTIRARKRRVCDNSPSHLHHFIEPGEQYERQALVVIGPHPHWLTYACCDACMAGWDGYSPYPGAPELVPVEVAKGGSYVRAGGEG